MYMLVVCVACMVAVCGVGMWLMHRTSRRPGD